MFYVYILYSKKLNNFYMGYSSNLKERLKDHKNNQVATTANKGFNELVCYVAFKTKQKALEFEKYLKSSSGFAFRNKRLV